MRMTLAVALAVLAACGKKPPPSAPPVSNTGTTAAPPIDPADDGDGGDGYGGSVYGGDGYGLVEYHNPPPPPAEDLEIAGLWISACTAGDAKGEFHQLRYDLEDTTWDFRAEVFADAGCTKRKSSLHMTGTYAVGARSQTVTGAFETTATYTARDLTADDKKTAAALGKRCGIKLVPGVATDIHTKGCAVLDAAPASALCEEHDIVSTANGSLRSGARTAGADLCGPDKRPAALSTVELHVRWKSIGLGDCDALGLEYEKLAVCAAIPSDQKAVMSDSVRVMNRSLAAQAAKSKETAEACKAAVGPLAAQIKKLGC